MFWLLHTVIINLEAHDEIMHSRKGVKILHYKIFGLFNCYVKSLVQTESDCVLRFGFMYVSGQNDIN